MNRRIWIAVTFAGAAALAYLLVFRPSDEERVRRQIATLTASVRIDASERDPRERPLRIQQAFRRVFTRSVRVNIADLVEDIHGRDELAGMAVSAAETFSAVTLDFSRVKVEIDGRERIARAEAVATLQGTDHEGHAQREEREVIMVFEDVEGEWRIGAIATR